PARREHRLRSLPGHRLRRPGAAHQPEDRRSGDRDAGGGLSSKAAAACGGRDRPRTEEYDRPPLGAGHLDRPGSRCSGLPVAPRRGRLLQCPGPLGTRPSLVRDMGKYFKALEQAERERMLREDALQRARSDETVVSTPAAESAAVAPPPPVQ